MREGGINKDAREFWIFSSKEERFVNLVLLHRQKINQYYQEFSSTHQ